MIPRDQFLFLRTEDFKKDTRGHMEIIFKFLALGQCHRLSLRYRPFLFTLNLVLCRCCDAEMCRKWLQKVGISGKVQSVLQ